MGTCCLSPALIIGLKRHYPAFVLFHIWGESGIVTSMSWEEKETNLYDFFEGRGGGKKGVGGCIQLSKSVMSFRVWNHKNSVLCNLIFTFIKVRKSNQAVWFFLGGWGRGRGVGKGGGRGWCIQFRDVFQSLRTEKWGLCYLSFTFIKIRK